MKAIPVFIIIYSSCQDVLNNKFKKGEILLWKCKQTIATIH